MNLSCSDSPASLWIHIHQIGTDVLRLNVVRLHLSRTIRATLALDLASAFADLLPIPAQRRSDAA
jgi:hypothetical protein